MTHSARAIQLASLGVLLLAGQAKAQEHHQPSPAEICAAAEKVISVATDPRIVSAAYIVLSGCPNSAATFASAWSTPPVDSQVLFHLVRKSSDLSDRRILDATLPVLQNAGLPEATRRAALDVVLAQFHPSFRLGNDTWLDPEHTSMGNEFDYYQAPGEQPITSADRQRIIATFHQMSISAADSQWRRVAKRIESTLAAFP